MSQHSVTLSWTASPDMPSPIPAGDGYNLYRGIDPAVPGPVPINGSTPIAADTFVDTNVQGGVTYNYFAVAVIGGNLSADSNQVSAQVPVFPPTGLTAVAA
jgi:hypothetical protein